MSHGRPDCVLCGEPVIGTKNAYRRVTGWAPMRAAGGANRIALPDYGAWAHKLCVDAEVSRAKRGVHPDQAAWEF